MPTFRNVNNYTQKFCSRTSGGVLHLGMENDTENKTNFNKLENVETQPNTYKEYCENCSRELNKVFPKGDWRTIVSGSDDTASI